MVSRRECEYRHQVYSKADQATILESFTSPLSVLCTLTGHACLCETDWQHCTRRVYALEYVAKHPKAPRQFEGMILTDAEGHVTDVI
jgi:hypothetical protein